MNTRDNPGSFRPVRDQNLPSLLSKDRIIAPPGFNRWKVPPASVAIHLCLGSVYAWSLFNPPLTRSLGVVASTAEDWSLPSVVWIFSVAIVFLGLSAAFAGRWLEQVGPRMVGVVSTLCWCGGFLLSALGAAWHQLWLLYLGYGVIGGCGLGLGYVSPVSTLIRWFPDRRGMAAGIAIMGFGGGAMVGTPLKESLLKTFFVAPTSLGTTEQVPLETRHGRRFAAVDGRPQEVVVLSAAEARQLPVKCEPGVYLVGTGRTGIVQTFLVLSGLYFVVMMLAAFSYRLPPPGWTPEGWAPPTAADAQRKMINTRNVELNEALKTPQFYLLWIMLCFNVTAGIGVLGVAKTMVAEIFGSTLPHIATSSFAATYVLMTSVFNMIGRFFWASVSDVIGRKNTYHIFFAAGIVLYLVIPYAAYQAGVRPSVVWLVLFYAVTMLIFTLYGGGFATIPAYIADLFGTKFVGGIHGRLLTAWSTAGVLGPVAISLLRDFELQRSLIELSSRIEPTRFRETFGASPDQLPELIAAKTVTLSKLMELAPPGTINPSCTLYNSTMYLMAVLLVIAFTANCLMRPVAARHLLKEDASAA